MQITYRNMKPESKEDRLLLANWYNDRSITHLFNLFRSEEESGHTFTEAEFLRRGEHPPQTGPFGNLFIVVDGIPVGEARFETDTPKLLTKKAHTGWLSLVIADGTFRGRGLGAEVVSHLEERLSASGAKRVEVGVFEYNETSLHFFSGLGYEEIARRNGRVWWRGQMWSEIRLLKTLGRAGQ